ncbi:MULTISPECIES: putative holin-like toxin [Staphylococcus]
MPMVSLNLERKCFMSVFEAISIMIAFCDLQFTILVFIFLYISNRKK